MAENLFDRVLGWLRAGYPQGVPQQDYVALFGVLRRSLTSAEVERIAEALRAHGDMGSEVSDEQVRAMIADTVLQTPSEEDVRRVRTRLAMGGWPLAEDLRKEAVERAVAAEVGQAEDPPASKRGRIQRMLDWLRAGYPQGIPSDDYMPLVALLGRRLSEDELVELGESLRESGLLPPDSTDIGQAYLAVTGELATPEQLQRVQQRLLDAGWEIEPTR